MKTILTKIRQVIKPAGLLLVVLTITTLNTFSQNSKFDLIKTDPFTGEIELRIDTKYNNFFDIGLYKKGEMYRIESNVIIVGRQSSALPVASKLDIKLGNGNSITLKSAAITEPTTSAGYTTYDISYIISKEQFQQIANNGIQIIRTHLQGETYYDYKMKKEEITKIKSNALYILNYNPKMDANKNSTAPSGYFAMNMAGLGLPVGSFATKMGGLSTAGYAKPGYNFNLSMGIPINHSNFGIALMGGGFINSFDSKTYLNSIGIPAPDKTGLSNVGGGNSIYLGGDFMTGLFATYPATKWFSLDFRLMGGIMIFHRTSMEYNSLDISGGNDINYNYTADFSTNPSFAYDAGLAFRITPPNKWRAFYDNCGHQSYERTMGIVLGIDFMSANPGTKITEKYSSSGTSYNTTPYWSQEYLFYNYTINNINNTTSNNSVSSIPISMVNISIGFTYSF